MGMWITILGVLLVLTALFLILLVLVQRGKGGGLAGAFGGMGGQSAFGTKAGDLFTKVTIVVAAFWIILCMITVKVAGMAGQKFDPNLGGAGKPQEGITAPAETEGEGEKPATPAAPSAEEPKPAPKSE